KFSFPGTRRANEEECEAPCESGAVDSAWLAVSVRSGMEFAAWRSLWDLGETECLLPVCGRAARLALARGVAPAREALLFPSYLLIRCPQTRPCLQAVSRAPGFLRIL